MPPSAVPAKLILYQDNTQQIRLYGLQDVSVSPPVFITTATITASLEDEDGNPVSNLQAIPLVFQTNSNGNYFGLVTSAFSAPVATNYKLIIDGDNSGSHLHMEILTEVRARNT